MNAAVNPPAKGHVQIRDVSVRFGRGESATTAVNGVSLDVAPGDFVTIIGPSGCGKSTLLNIVAGFLKASDGTVTLDGQPIDGPGPERGVVFQQYSLFPWMTVRKNVEFGLRMQGHSANSRETAARTLLGLAGLLQFENHYPDQLSGGMKQRVAIARALSVNPAVMLMDEPLSALDSQTRELLLDDLVELWSREKFSACYVTHNLAEAVRLGHKIIVLSRRPGRIRQVVEIDIPLAERAGRLAELEETQRHLWNLMRDEARAADMELADVA
jgi:NitT/TauT family transport system ATP-binding protein